MSKILFKKSLRGRLEEEFLQIDLGLRAVLFTTNGFMQHYHGKGITVVTLHRTDAEQDLLYAGYPSYQKKPWKSFHQVWWAADIRYAPFDFDQWAGCVVFLENAFRRVGFHARIHTPDDSLWPAHIHVEIHKPTEEGVRNEKS